MTSPPKPPAGLLKPSRDRWNAFWQSHAAATVDPASDMPRLARWIEAVDEYDRVMKVVKKSRLVRGSMDQPVLNPLIAYLISLDGLVARAETEFGMTPSARVRLKLALPRPAPGPVEGKVRADIAALVTAHPMGEALAEVSVALARMLDDRDATVTRELRANLLELSRLAVDDNDDLDDELSTPVRDDEKP